MLKQEQEIYAREGIRWKEIEFEDNQECIDLIDARHTGVFAVLDEECRLKVLPLVANGNVLAFCCGLLLWWVVACCWFLSWIFVGCLICEQLKVRVTASLRSGRHG